MADCTVVQIFPGRFYSRRRISFIIRIDPPDRRTAPEGSLTERNHVPGWVAERGHKESIVRDAYENSFQIVLHEGFIAFPVDPSLPRGKGSGVNDVGRYADGLGTGRGSTEECVASILNLTWKC